MKRNVALYITSIFLIGLTSCGKDPVATTPTTTPTTTEQPKAGSKWVYRYTYYNQDGTIKGTTDVTYNASEITFSGSKWLLLIAEQSAITKAGDTALIAQKRSDGIWMANIKNNTSSMWIKDPAAKGDNYLTAVSDGTTDTVKVQDVNVTVTVPAGNITGCYMSKEYDTNSLEDDLWFHADKWLVKQIEYDQDVNNNLYKDFMVELVSYTK